MPNECHNRIVIIGKKAEIERVLQFIDSEGSNYYDEWKVWDVSDGYRVKKDGFLEKFPGISFLSSWSPALHVSEELSVLFSELTFKHRYEELNADFSGYIIYKNGEILKEKTGNYGDFPA